MMDLNLLKESKDAKDAIKRAEEDIEEEWKRVNEVKDMKQWNELIYKLIPLRIVLVGTQCTDNFKDLHKAVSEKFPGEALFIHMPTPISDSPLICGNIYFFKGEFEVKQISLSEDAWKQVKEETFKAINSHACLVIAGTSSSETERFIFLKDIDAAFQKLVVISPKKAAAAIKGAKEITQYPGLFEIFPVERNTKTNRWSHLLFSIDPSSEQVHLHIEYILLNPYIGCLDVVYCGHGSEDGDWILHDCDFTRNMYFDTITSSLEKRNDSKFTLTGNVIFNCCYGGIWSGEMITDVKLSKFSVNIRPIGVPTPIPIEGLFQCRSLENAMKRLLPTEDTCDKNNPLPNGDYRELPTNPTVIVFPAGNGDCSLFAFGDFCMLVDGGRYNKGICCWKYVARLPKIDAAVVTHVDADHILGIGALLRILNYYKNLQYESKTKIRPPSKAKLPVIEKLYFNCPQNYEESEIQEPKRGTPYNILLFRFRVSLL
ncbi:Microtubule-associated protein 1A [Terramyces sp. JEL0728]|nr:Microtubule-associated protein 1A [Terramyces sp. JEL0728]